MSMPYFNTPRAGPEPELHSGNVSLEIRQNPKTALVTLSRREKNRKPIDPPPIVQMRVHDPNIDTSWLVSPYLFLIASLLSDDHGDEVLIGDQYVIGQSSSSLNRLKDVDNKDGGFFVFGDISVRRTGIYRLRFSLFNQNKSTHDVEFLSSIDSTPFIVQSNKDFGGLSESSHLSRTFSDQGVRLRLRKEQRKLTGQKRGYQSVDSSPAVSNQHGEARSSNDYARSGPAFKRQRADSNYGVSRDTPYGRLSGSGYLYTGNGITPGGYYPTYETPGQTLNTGHEYDPVGLAEGFPSHALSDQYPGMSRQVQTAAPAGPFHEMPIKDSPSEHTSYFGGYPTPTRTGSYSAQINAQSSALYPQSSLPQQQQQQYMQPESGYGGPSGRTYTVDPHRPQPSAYHSRQIPTATHAHQVTAATSQPYALATPSTDASQTYDPINGFGGNSLLYSAVDTINTSGAMPSTPLTSSTLNSAYTAHFGEDTKGQPPDQQASGVFMPQYPKPTTPR